MDGDCVTAPSERKGYVQLYDGLIDVHHELTQEEFAQYEAVQAQRTAQRAEEQAAAEEEKKQHEEEKERLRTLVATSPDLHVVLHVPAETPHDSLLDLVEERLAKLWHATSKLGQSPAPQGHSARPPHAHDPWSSGTPVFVSVAAPRARSGAQRGAIGACQPYPTQSCPQPPH
jgi:hypothetical protein